MFRQVWGYIHDDLYYCVFCAERMARDRGLTFTDEEIDAEDWKPVYAEENKKSPRCNDCGITKGWFVPQR